MVRRKSIPNHLDHVELQSLPSAAPVPYILPCYLDMCSPWPGDRTTDLPIRRQPTLPPESQLIIEIAELIMY